LHNQQVSWGTIIGHYKKLQDLLLEYAISVCRHPHASIGLEFEEYTWREGEFLYFQVCAVGTDVAFPLTAEMSIYNRTGTWSTTDTE
jgi:hypothetical protein